MAVGCSLQCGDVWEYSQNAHTPFPRASCVGSLSESVSRGPLIIGVSSFSLYLTFKFRKTIIVPIQESNYRPLPERL